MTTLSTRSALTSSTSLGASSGANTAAFNKKRKSASATVNERVNGCVNECQSVDGRIAADKEPLSHTLHRIRERERERERERNHAVSCKSGLMCGKVYSCTVAHTASLGLFLGGKGCNVPAEDGVSERQKREQDEFPHGGGVEGCFSVVNIWWWLKRRTCE